MAVASADQKPKLSGHFVDGAVRVFDAAASASVVLSICYGAFVYVTPSQASECFC